MVSISNVDSNNLAKAHKKTLSSIKINMGLKINLVLIWDFNILLPLNLMDEIKVLFNPRSFEAKIILINFHLN